MVSLGAAGVFLKAQIPCPECSGCFDDTAGFGGASVTVDTGCGAGVLGVVG